ncbi:MAG: ABC transporter permease [Chloroflexi bacterium]|nr:ABC transporter permease [Chloroflexota bacterium]MYD49164.1 ABC transporter permease [Chloroflexota bacterium]
MIDQTTEQAAIAREAMPAPGLTARWWTAFMRFIRTKPLGAVGGLIVVLLVLVAALAPVLSPYDPRSTPALPWESPNADFLLGADYVGRDVLSRLIYGARISLYVGLGSVLVGITASFIIGVALTYIGGIVDMVAQRIVDALMSLPGLLIALAIMAVVTPSLNTVILAIVIGMIAPVIRTVRSQVLSLKELDYVTAATAIGAPPWRIIFRHIVPNCFATYLVLATYYLGFAIIIESSLSFLGVGTPPDQPSWGGMLVRAASAHVKSGPWLAICPGLAIFLVVMGFNLLGDALRDVFDPRLRGR